MNTPTNQPTTNQKENTVNINPIEFLTNRKDEAHRILGRAVAGKEDLNEYDPLLEELAAIDVVLGLFEREAERQAERQTAPAPAKAPRKAKQPVKAPRTRTGVKRPGLPKWAEENGYGKVVGRPSNAIIDAYDAAHREGE